MLLRDAGRQYDQGDPKKNVAVAMVLLTVGLMFLGVGLLWSTQSHPVVGSGDTNDFLRGMMMGIGIALEIGAVVIGFSAATAAKKSKGTGPVPRQ